MLVKFLLLDDESGGGGGEYCVCESMKYPAFQNHVYMYGCLKKIYIFIFALVIKSLFLHIT